MRWPGSRGGRWRNVASREVIRPVRRVASPALKRIRLSLRARAWRSTMIGAQGLPEALTSALLLLFRSRRAWLRYSQRFSSFFSPAGLALCATSRAMRRSISGTSTLSSWPR